jgi:hypothetical protein
MYYHAVLIFVKQITLNGWWTPDHGSAIYCCDVIAYVPAWCRTSWMKHSFLRKKYNSITCSYNTNEQIISMAGGTPGHGSAIIIVRPNLVSHQPVEAYIFAKKRPALLQYLHN